MATKRPAATPDKAPAAAQANASARAKTSALPAPFEPDVAAALAAFDTNDITPFDAMFYGVAHVDLKRFLALRMQPTVAAGDEIRKMLKTEGITSAMLLEQGAAAAYEAAGAHGKALETRLEALADCPRYDGFFTALLLSRTAGSLLALDRADEALPLAERALRFQPLDPPAMVIASRARTAVGDDAGAARLRAWLYDVGTSPAYLPGTPTEADLAAEPYVCDFDALEPLSDEDMARYLILFRIDVGLEGTLVAGRRHLGAQLRYAAGAGGVGLWQAAKTASAFYREGSPTWSDAGSWLGFPITMNNEYVATQALIDAIAEASTDKKHKVVVEPRDLAHRLAGVRKLNIREQAAAGATVPRHLLTDLIWDVAEAAAKALPNDPLVVALRAHEADEDLQGMVPKVFSDELADAACVPHTTGCRDHFLRDGVRIQYPHQNAQTPLAREDDWYPFIEHAPTGRSKCKVCKAAIAAGEPRLVVRSKLCPVDSTYAHAACAPGHKKLGPEWKKAVARTRIAAVRDRS